MRVLFQPAALVPPPQGRFILLPSALSLLLLGACREENDVHATLLDQKNARIEQLTEEVRQLQYRVLRLNQQLDFTGDQVASAKKELDRACTRLQVAIDTKQSRIVSLQGHVDSHREQLASSNYTGASSVAGKELTAEIQAQRKDLAELQERMKELKEVKGLLR